MWNGLWPVQAVLLALLALVLSGVLPALGPWLHGLGLILGLTWLGWVLWQRRAAWQPPTHAEAVRRLERDSDTAHRPLQGLDDRLLDDHPAARALWEAHQRRLAASLGRLWPRLPRNGLPRLDRFAWRAGAFLAVVVAGFLAGPDWRMQLEESLWPRFAAAAPSAQPVVEVWAEPPAYTGRAPIFAPPPGEELRFPSGSKLAVQVSNAPQPTLALDANRRDLTEVAAGQYSLSLTVDQAQRLAVQAGEVTLAAWPVFTVPDRPPTARFAEAPSTTARQALRLDYALQDDYGITAAWAELRPATPEARTAGAKPLRLPFPLGSGGPADIRSSLFRDLTPHRWAGQRVLVTLHATDSAQQTGTSETLAVVLPERRFTHPVAQQIIAARKDLDRGLDPIDVARDVAQIASYPARFDDDTVVYLALGSAFHRLRRGSGEAMKTAVRDLLWDTALRVEDGTLPAAERNLRTAQQALQDALTRNASPEEIRRLMDELREAVRRFAAEMASRTGEPPPSAQADTATRSVRNQDLERMLDRIQDLAEMGSRDAAQNLLSQLQQMLENVRQAQRMTPQQQQRASDMARMLNQLQEMQRRQQSLMDRTFRQNQQAGPTPDGPPNPNAGQPGLRLPNIPGLRQGPPQPAPDRPPQAQPQGQQESQPLAGLAQEQDRLRRDLGEVMRQIGERFGSIPEAMQQAEQSMRAAGNHLQQGAGEPALEAEGQALESLRQAGQGMAQQLARQLGIGTGQSPGGRQNGSNGPGTPRRDPLGREGGTGQASEAGPRIPDESEMQRARRIRDTLYKRSADPDRPILEQDYLKRLLEQF